MFLHVHRYIHASVYLFSLILPLKHNMHNYLSAHLLGYIHTDLPENKSVYLHASLSSNHKDLPVTTTTCVHARRCTHTWLYLFIFILLFWLTAKIYPSTFLPLYMSTYIYLFISIPVQFISSFSALHVLLSFHSSAGVCTHRSTRK